MSLPALKRGVSIYKTVKAEVCAESPVITRYSALFVIHAVLLLWFLLLAVCTAVAVQTRDNDWYKDFLVVWGIAYFVLFVLDVAIYDSWVSGCHVLTSKAESRMVIGRPMHLAIQKSMIATAALTAAIFFALVTVFNLTDSLKKPLDHSATAGTLYFLLLAAQLGIAATASSLSHQLYPRINVSQVTVFISSQ
jgi:hypothetical protein